MKIRMISKPEGLLNGQEWPEIGETFDLADVAAEDAIASGIAEKASGGEKAPAKKAAAKKTAAKKPAEGETRPAPTDKAETRTAKKA